VTTDLHLAAWALVIGSMLFLVGAGFAPEPTRVFSGDLGVYLDVLHRRRRSWLTMNVLMIAGVATTAAGFVALGTVTPEPVLVGGVIYTVAAVPWIVALGSRATIDTDVAGSVARGERVPDAFHLVSRLTGAGFRTYLLLAYAAIVAAGAAVVAHGDLPAYAGWFAVGFGSAALLGNAVNRPVLPGWGPLFEPPFMVHLPTLVLGIAFLGRHAVQ